MEDAPNRSAVLSGPSGRLRRSLFPFILIPILAAWISGCRRSAPSPGASVPPPHSAPSAGGTALPSAIPFAEPDESQWIRPARDYASSRYSTLDQINTETVRNLKVAFTFSTGVSKGHEAAPLVVNGTMYIVTPYPNYLYALDLTKPGAPAKWVYKPKTLPSAQGVACCDVVNRGAAYDRGRVFFNTLDDQTVAVDAETGKEVWRTRVGDINHGESMTMAPLVVKGKVLVGNSGGEFGVRGWLTALDADSGKVVWRAWSTGPDKEVLIGPRFKPFYASDKGTDLGMTSWPGDLWKIGGGTVWGWVSYDPQLDLIYYGTSNPGPWNPDQRPGDNKWTAAVIARSPDDGQAVWAYQMSPHDLYDYDGVNENVLLDLPIGGRMRKTLLRADRDGFFYVIDRTSGEVLSANPFAYVTTRTGVDLATGRPKEVEELKPQVGRTVRGICPAAPGGKDWQPMAFSPRTGLVYIPHNHLCQDEEGVQANYIEGTPFVGANVKMYAAPGGHRGEFTAWDPVAGKPVWKIKEKFPAWSGALATAGDVVFYGTMDGWFQAVHARTGEVLWRFKTGSGIIGQPITYRGPDGKQYVAILSGVGGWSGAIVSNNLDPRDGTAALGFVNAMGDLPSATTAGGMLYVFALP
ncbi:MAG TPA: methanol/ethanol family PQQ-dependent dehydrogenase [Thermoanaerobaculia bacterium]|nr:methanol/ethanol family PQQ-dependent dehydrogenase [Thermoanaerobaculia bacterium]